MEGPHTIRFVPLEPSNLRYSLWGILSGQFGRPKTALSRPIIIKCHETGRNDVECDSVVAKCICGGYTKRFIIEINRPVGAGCLEKFEASRLVWWSWLYDE